MSYCRAKYSPTTALKVIYDANFLQPNTHTTTLVDVGTTCVLHFIRRRLCFNGAADSNLKFAATK